ncbi:VPLPA-CTERM sorting domain-containing protein [Methylomonas sp. MED-D]|uniref:VPLPA-CTERM sorting domain-containing protein n=1 Tax=Methylomonas sp. MED-D TaxID=3418768 RepID=UPI003CFC5D9E
MSYLPKSFSRSVNSLALGIGLALSQGAAAATLDLDFSYRMTPGAGALGTTIATAHFEDVITSTGFKGIDLTLTNVASDQVPGVGSTSYISGLLLAFDFADEELPNIIIEQFDDDNAQSDRWEPQEDVATVDGFTFTSELGFPKGTSNPSSSTSLASLRVGDSAHIQFWWDTGLEQGDLTVASLVEALRGGSADAAIPDIMAAVKVRSLGAITGGENIESVATLVVGAVEPTAAPVPVPAALPLFASALAGFGVLRRRRA